MPELSTEPEVQNQVETETPENDSSQTVDGDTTPAEGQADDAKQKGDYYAAELARLKGIEDEKRKVEEALAEKERQLAIKERALQAEKKKVRSTTDDGTIDKAALKRELLAEIRVDSELDKIARSTAERQVIEHHYKNSIVRTGDVQEDLRRAMAVANANRMQDLLQRNADEGAQEEKMASSMLSGSMRGSGGPSKGKTHARAEAEAILRAINPKAVEYLDNYLP